MVLLRLSICLPLKTSIFLRVTNEVPSPPVFVDTALSTSPTQSKRLWMFEWMFTEWKVRRVDGQLDGWMDGCIHAWSSELQVAPSNPGLLCFLQWQSN